LPGSLNNTLAYLCRVIPLGDTVTVSAKVDKKLKKEMDQLKVSPSEVIQRALREEVRARKKEAALKSLKEIGPILRKVSKEEWTKAVRAGRDSR
jgi:hypothetical protein